MHKLSLVRGLSFFLLSTAPDLWAQAKLTIKSPSTLVMDLKTREVLFEREADTVRPIASLSKMMAALVLYEQCPFFKSGNLDSLHEMSIENREAAKGGDKSKLITGWQFSYRDLLHAALMRSDNRALPALGEACKLDRTSFATLMNERAKQIGLKSTQFTEPTGLSRENMSTAREFMAVLEETSKIKALSEIMTKREYYLTGYKENKPPKIIKIHSTDRLLNKNIVRVLAGKTGYTDLARYCLAILVETEDNRRLGMVFLGAEGRFTRFADVERVLQWIDQVKKNNSPSPPRPLESPATLEAASRSRLNRSNSSKKL